MSRTTITVPTQILSEAKSLGVNVSRVVQTSLAREVAHRKAAEWSRANADAIAEYNRHIATHGLLLADQGTW